VALVPAAVPNLIKAGLQVVVEAGAGAGAGYPDADYAAKGARDRHRSRRSVSRRGHCGANPLSRVQRQDRQGRCSALPQRPGTHRVLRPLGSIETIQEIAAKGVDFVFPWN